MAKDKLSCEVCGTKNDVMKLCVGCRNVFYCGKECQKLGWQKHKFLCGPDPRAASQRPTSAAEEEPPKPPPAVPEKPLQSGVRVLPDGGYEQYSQGKLVGRNGQDLREADRMRQHAGKETRVLSCVACSGNGCKTETVDGIVRKEFCVSCNGEGCYVIDQATGQRIAT